MPQGKLIGYETPRPFGTQPLPVYPLYGGSTPESGGNARPSFPWRWGTIRHPISGVLPGTETKRFPAYGVLMNV